MDFLGMVLLWHSWAWISSLILRAAYRTIELLWFASIGAFSDDIGIWGNILFLQVLRCFVGDAFWRTNGQSCA